VKSFRVCLAAFAAAVVIGVPRAASAQTDEIQVYDGGLAPVGVFNLTWHNNFTPKGLTAPAFPGAVVSDKSWNGVPEWAFGATPWLELGLYMPLYSRDNAMGFGFDGFKIRTLFAVPHADDRKFFYGTNFEFSFNQKRWDEKRHTAEIRPIIGWHFSKVDLIINPILDTSYDGVKNLEFVPSERLAYNINKVWAIAVEEYADYGPIHQFAPVGSQYHQIWGVFDRSGKSFDIEAGAGIGLNDATDRLTLKLLVSHDFNPKK